MSDEQPEPFKVIDRRGQSKPDRAPAFRPDEITDIRATDDPMVWVAVMPGNRVPEQRFKVSRLEAQGFNLLARRVRGIGPEGQKACQSARRKVLKVMEAAMRAHLAKPGKAVAQAGGVH